MSKDIYLFFEARLIRADQLRNVVSQKTSSPYMCLKSEDQGQTCRLLLFLPENKYPFKILRYVLCRLHIYFCNQKSNRQVTMFSRPRFDQQNCQEGFQCRLICLKVQIPDSMCCLLFSGTILYIYAQNVQNHLNIVHTCFKGTFSTSHVRFLPFLDITYIHNFPKISNPRRQKEQM